MMEAVSTEEKVRFLKRPDAYPHAPSEVLTKETHLSWIFLAGDQVLKLKKPLVVPPVDFSSLAAREKNCHEELRLNRRLAPTTYLGLVALTKDTEGRLALNGEGDVIDWLVRMRRLPADRMLDVMITQGLVSEEDLNRLAGVLAAFYERAERPVISPMAYADRFMRDQAVNRELLSEHPFGLDQELIASVLDRLDRDLIRLRPLLENRVHEGWAVDGHGDLRPEHICLTEPIAIFDCLEFSPDLRLSDPFDELAYLDLECRMIGASWIGPSLMARLVARLGGQPPETLMRLYTAFRAVLRSRQSLAHLLDPIPREPQKWAPLAARYLDIADGVLIEW